MKTSVYSAKIVLIGRVKKATEVKEAIESFKKEAKKCVQEIEEIERYIEIKMSVFIKY